MNCELCSKEVLDLFDCEICKTRFCSDCGDASRLVCNDCAGFNDALEGDINDLR